MRNVDLGLLAVALPIFLAAGWPIVGWITGAGLYVFQRLVGAWTTRRASRADDPRTIVGLLAGSMILRGWIVAGVILAVGLATESENGLSSAVLFLTTFTMAFSMNLILRGAQPRTPPRRAAP